MSDYDEIGEGYDYTRRADPRIARQLRAALGDVESVVNVGAGTGSYEPSDLEVVAVEPSVTMTDQRTGGAAKVVQAKAESLPFEDNSFDAAMAVLSTHHWSAWQVGVREMRRVASKRVVVMTWDPLAARGFWLHEYVPRLSEFDATRFYAIEQLEKELGRCRVEVVVVPHDCEDGFLGAYWRRPWAYLDPKIRRGMSSFALDGHEDEVAAGMARLKKDLDSAMALAGACEADGSGSTSGLAAGGAGGTGGTGGAGGSEGLTIEGLSGPVQALYDDNGILHLSCATDEDCYAALGYFHASNRFFFMDFVRNLVRGRLGSLVNAGDTVLSQDYANRLIFSDGEGTPLEEKLLAAQSERTQTLMAAFTTGVNAWIADMRAERNGATLTTEYDFAFIEKEAVRDWEAEDSAAVGLFVLESLSNSAGEHVSLADRIPAFDPALSADLYTPRPVFDAATLPASMVQFSNGSLNMAALAERFAPLRSLMGQAANVLDQVGRNGILDPNPMDFGSNNWAVMGSRTTSGNAIVANDPHLELSNPSIWFAVEMDAKSDGSGDTHVAGSTFPGLPTVMVGHNEDIAWGVTTANYDLTDIYVETLSADGTTVSFNGQDVPVLEKDFTFEDVGSGETITRTFRYVPHHGPIISEEGTTALTMRWRGADAITDLDGFFELSRAGSVDEARTAVENIDSANQNFVVIDMEGNLGWFPYVAAPERPWASLAQPAWLPIPGDGTAEWGPEIPKSMLPQAVNPVNGAIATANQDHTGATFDGDPFNDMQPAYQTWFKASGAREQRILDLLEAGGAAHSVETMNDMHGDTYSLLGEVMVPALLTAAAGMTLTPDEQSLVDALAAWQLTCPTGLDGSDPEMAGKSTDATEAAESIGCTAFHTVFYATLGEALDDEEEVAGTSTGLRADLNLVLRAIQDPAGLTPGNMFWDDVSTSPQIETQDDILQRAISAATAVLVDDLGAADEWRWGRVHTLTLNSIFNNFGIGSYNEGPYAAPGGQFTVNVANPASRSLPADDDPISFAFVSGPSVRFVVEATPEGMRMTYQLPGGNDLHRDSPFYNNLLPNWLEVTSIDFPFGPGAVPEPAVEVTVNPAE